MSLRSISALAAPVMFCVIASSAVAQMHSSSSSMSGTGMSGSTMSGTGSGTSMSKSSMANVTPASFVEQASRDGLAEVQLGKLAADKAAAEPVRKFAQQMVTDHSKANAELTKLAAGKNLPVATAVDSTQKQMMTRLGGLSGDNFDKAYMTEMTAAHNKAVALFMAATESSDADIASFAKKTLPTLKMHEQMAASLSTASAAR